MFPYLHSSQIESGYNFSNIKNLNLDILLENYSLASYIPDNIYRLDPLINSYITKKKTIDKENKSPFDFIKFLFTSLFK